MFDNLTLQQFCALDYHRNMVVTAGPGAGKTRILSHRFCFILLTDDSVSLPGILTLTFTEKAAEEMKTRIYRILSGLERDLKDIPDILLRERIRDAREKFHKNRISTIHSFCAGLLRENPVEAGIDPGFAVVQGAKQKSIMDRAVEEGVSSIWQENKNSLLPLMQSFGGRGNLLAAIRNLIEHPLSYKRVCETKERLFNMEGWEKQVLKEYCRHISGHYLVPYLDGLRSIEKRSAGHEELLSLLEEWHADSKHDQEYSGVPDLFRSMRRMADKRKSYSSSLPVNEGLRKISYIDLVKDFYPDVFINHQPDIIFAEQLDLFISAAGICMDRYRKEKENINALDFADLETLTHDFLSSLRAGRDTYKLGKIRQRFRYVMVDEFQDTNRIQWGIISMLCSENREDPGEYMLDPGKLFVVGDKRQAIYGFRGGDVTVFESVTRKIKGSNPAVPAPMFWENQEINDRMNAVYKGYSKYLKDHLMKFDAETDENRKNILDGDVYLPHNFRTDSRPIAFFNDVFTSIFGNRDAADLYEYETAPRRIIRPENSGDSAERQGSVSFYLSLALTSGEDQAETEASLIVDIIERISGRHGTDSHEYRNYPDIREKIVKKQLAVGILFSTFTNIRTFENIFRDAGLSFKVHRGKGFYRCTEVMEMVQLLNYLSDERQNISLLSVLRGPVFGVTDSEIFDLFHGNSVTPELVQSSQNPYLRKIGEHIESWRFLSCQMTLSELIRKIISDRSLTAIYTGHPNGVQRLANMEKLIETARTFQAQGNGSLQEFVAHCLEMADEEEKEGEALTVSGGGSPIWLMTIHAAKGLEFPMVILPGLDRRLPSRLSTGKPVRLYPSKSGEMSDWNSREGEIPVWPVEIPELAYIKRSTPLGFLLKRREYLENLAETRRVFYVGCTRAENHLLLLGSMKKRLIEEKKMQLSSEDYRERGTILELLDDIYDFNRLFPFEKSKIYECDKDMPSVIWKDPEPRKFKGLEYKSLKVSHESFGTYDAKLRSLDLTRAIGSSSYSQFSFKSIRQYMRCPIGFYFNVILGIRGEGYGFDGIEHDTLSGETAGQVRDYDEEYGSEKALLLGSFIHAYMERYLFGEKMDLKLFDDLWDVLIDRESVSRVLDEETLSGIRHKALDHLETIINDKALNKMLSVKADCSEVPFLFRFSNECEFRGVIDRLFKDPASGLWAILDWKSNDLSGKDPAAVAEANGYNLQLACYRWAVEKILDEKLDDLYIYFSDRGYLYKSTCSVRPEAIVREMLDRIEQYRKNKNRLVEDMKDIRENPEKCLFCEYNIMLCQRF